MTTRVLVLAGALLLSFPMPALRSQEVPEDVADVPCEELQAGKDPRKRYFLIGHDATKTPSKKPGLVVVLPGGTGEASFNPFVRRIWKHALGEDYVVAQVVAVKWKEDQKIIWPTAKSRVPGMEFTTEELVRAVVGEVAKKARTDPQRVFTLSWSSSGPAAYQIAVTDPAIKGSFVAMSVFKPAEMDDLDRARGHAFYIFHSPADETCPYRMAEEAAAVLKKKGAETTLVSYEGGHQWAGPIYQHLKTGFAWLEKSAALRRRR